MQKLAIAVAAIATLASTSVLAVDMPVNAPPVPAWGWSGFYVGAGGSFNWTSFKQELQGVSGVQDVTLGTVPFAKGQEGGPFFDFSRNRSGFAPEVQLGYILPFAGDWLAGLKFNYKYANIDSKRSVSIPQTGILTFVGGISIPITGFVQVTPAEINLRHQFTLMPTIGRAFDRFTIYAGAGPALFNVKTSFFNALPFAQIGTVLITAAAEPITMTNDNWVWGGAAQIGATYAIAPRWFLDFAYTYAQSSNFNISDTASFTNSLGPLTTAGSGTLNAHERVTNQSLMLTLNRQF